VGRALQRSPNPLIEAGKGGQQERGKGKNYEEESMREGERIRKRREPEVSVIHPEVLH